MSLRAEIREAEIKARFTEARAAEQIRKAVWAIADDSLDGFWLCVDECVALAMTAGRLWQRVRQLRDNE